MEHHYPFSDVESKWRDAWQNSKCFQAPEQPIGEKFFNFDSGPFPNGALHLGHVRTYVLGDMTARYQRLLGKSVLYATEWDAFGHPNETEAIAVGRSPQEFTQDHIERMRNDLMSLGVSYDWSRVQSTCDPAYYRWTQWLFLLLFRRGLVQRRMLEGSWCPQCQAYATAKQVTNGKCWRCNSPVERRSRLQWLVAVAKYADRLDLQHKNLNDWSSTAKKLVRQDSNRDGNNKGLGSDQTEWSIGREKAWGAPIPVVYCTQCGIVAVKDLPVCLPADMKWSESCHSLANNREFIETTCPTCGSAAKRETETLDCFFDDAWSYLSCVTTAELAHDFPGKTLSPWLPVDRFHSGFDTHAYLNLYRFIGLVLHDEKILADSEPITSYHGHEMVTEGSRKMSKSVGNSISASSMLEKFGADALRVGVLWAASPQRTLSWNDSHCEKAKQFLGLVFNLYAKCAQQTSDTSQQADRSQGTTSQAVDKLNSQARHVFGRVGAFIEDYRPNAAIEELAILFRNLESFAVHRIQASRLVPKDAYVLRRLLVDSAVAISPFAPHLAEEIAQMCSTSQMVAVSRWPSD